MRLKPLIMAGIDRRATHDAPTDPKQDSNTQSHAKPVVNANAGPEASAREAAEIARRRRGQTPGMVLLRTCERIEVYSSGGADHLREILGAAGLEAEIPRITTRRGVAVVRHAMRVAAGLDSRLVGEPHVLGQMRRAAEASREVDLIGDDLDRLFARAIRCGRRVRRETDLGHPAMTYAGLASNRVAEWIHQTGSDRIAILGAGAAARDVGRDLRARGVGRLVFAGRHPGRTAALAHALGAQAVPLSAWPALAGEIDVLITATAAPHPIVRADDLAGARPGLLIVDLGMPPNVAASARAAGRARYLGLNELAPAHQPIFAIINEAESIVSDEVERLVHESRVQKSAIMEAAA